jgi:hypothetical protein
MVKLPAGTTTISGQLSHSRNTSFGFSARSSAAESGVVPHRKESETAQGGIVAGGTPVGFSMSAAGACFISSTNRGAGAGRCGGTGKTTAVRGRFSSSIRAAAKGAWMLRG